MVSVVLTIAGSDNSGGAGIQADLKTFTALGAYGVSAVTALTVQSARGVLEIYSVPSDAVFKQIEAVVSDFSIKAVKIGMLWKAEIVDIVSRAVEEFKLPNVVLDPVFSSTGGTPLLEKKGIYLLKEKLLPMTRVITPNLKEAEILCNRRITSRKDMLRCAEEILNYGVNAVIIKGGHLKGKKTADLLFERNKGFQWFVSEKIKRKVHGTGCAYSSALAVFLSKECSLADAAFKAKRYVEGIIENSISAGKGEFPYHSWNLRKCTEDF